MLNLDEERFVRIQAGAVALADGLDETVASALTTGTENVFFAGTGGARILMLPAAGLLERASTLPAYVAHPAELIAVGSPHFGPHSLVVVPSLSGTTKESLELLALANAKGARVLALTGHANSPLARGADWNFTNEAADDTSSESFYLQSLLVALSVLAHRGEDDDYATTVKELRGIPEALLEVKRGFEDRAAALAEAWRDEPYHIITGAGGTWAEALYYGMCILEEMQWIRTRPVHAADFFHGTLELVEPGVSVVCLKGEDAARPLVERVETFVRPLTDKFAVLDSADLPTPGISAATRALLSPVLLATVLERVSAHLEVLRDHPLVTRRYYRRMSY